MSGDVTPYTSLITPNFATQPEFVEMVSTVCQAFADGIAVVRSLPQAYDLDYAVGVQLDTVGLWIGATRRLTVPIDNIYFTFDTDGLGFDQGLLFGSGGSTPTDIISLPDVQFRTLLRAVAASNVWDGSLPNAYEVWDVLFDGTGYSIQIVDNGDMTMDLGLVGPEPDALTKALFENGYLSLRPAGVEITSYYFVTT